VPPRAAAVGSHPLQPKLSCLLDFCCTIGRFDDAHGASKSRQGSPPRLEGQFSDEEKEQSLQDGTGGTGATELPGFQQHMESVARMELLRGAMTPMDGYSHLDGCPPGCGCNPGTDFASGFAAAFGVQRPRRARHLSTRRQPATSIPSSDKVTMPQAAAVPS